MINVDVIKAAYRQTKDGFVVTFAIHPQDQHDALALADIGSQWNMQLVPLDENGNAGATPSPAAGERLQHSSGEAGGRPLLASRSNAGVSTPPARGAESNPSPPPVAPASRLTRQAAIACNDTLFWVFLTESGIPVSDANQAAVAVRLICHVISRKEFIPGMPAGIRWDGLWSRYQAWRNIPEEVA